MGTRASFFINDPQDLANREWLGCVSYDAYPSGDIGKILKNIKTLTGFKRVIKRIENSRNDFCNPKEFTFPFPWKNNLFLTDYTYAFMNGQVMVTSFHRGFVPIREVLKDGFDWEGEDTLPENVPAPKSEGALGGPDSIIILRV